MQRTLKLATAMLLVWLVAPFAVQAQTKTMRRGPAGFIYNVGGDVRCLPTKDTLLWLGLGGAASLAVRSEDKDIVEELATKRNLENFLDPGQWIGSEAVLAPATVLVWGVGRIAGNPGTCRLSSDLLRAQLISQVMTHSIKLTTQRTRPDGKKWSFPSGHASAMFACAAVMHDAYGWKVGAPSYLLASYVGMSRLTERRHYLSDVLFGASIGLISGRSVARHRAAQLAGERASAEHHRLPRFALAPSFLADGFGLALVRVPRYETCSPR